MSNYPPGMRESDIPGYNAVEVERAVRCNNCDFDGDVEGMVDKGIFDWDCPKCGENHEEDLNITDDDGDYEEDEDDFDEYAEEEPGW